jgi:hypothetical protein
MEIIKQYPECRLVETIGNYMECRYEVQAKSNDGYVIMMITHGKQGLKFAYECLEKYNAYPYRERMRDRKLQNQHIREAKRKYGLYKESDEFPWYQEGGKRL